MEKKFRRNKVLDKVGKKNPREFDMDKFLSQREKEEANNIKPKALTNNSAFDSHEGEFLFHPYGESKDYMAWYTQDMIHNIGKQALEYVQNNPRCINMISFFNTKMIYHEIWSQWRKKYPYIAGIDKMCMQIIADRRETGAAFREIEKEVAMRGAPYYYKQYWDEINNYWAEVKKKEQVDVPDVVQVQVSHIPDTGIPPARSMTQEEMDAAFKANEEMKEI